jgi:hypothetical protein
VTESTQIDCATPAWAPTDAPAWLAQSLRDYSRIALRSPEPCQLEFNIAGHSIRFCFAAPELARQLTRAIDHLRTPLSASPNCTIAVWEGTTSTRYPSLILKAYLTALECSWWDFTNPRGELLEINTPPLMAAYHPGTCGLSLLDTESGQGFYWKPANAEIPYYEAGSPFRTLLHWWFRAKGIQFIHGAAVGTPTGGVLLVGKGGSGKSTSALASINWGLQYAGDDYCAVGLSPTPAVYSLYNTCKLVGDEDIARFPGLAERVWNPVRGPEDKATFFLNEYWPERVAASLPLKAILVPRISGKKDTSIRPASGMEALSAMAPGTMAQLPSSDGQDLKFMSTAVKQLPSFVIEVGTDLPQIPAAIVKLLEGLP